MNDIDQKHIKLLESLHATKLEIAQAPLNFAREIMGLKDDVLADVADLANGRTSVGGEPVAAIVNRVLAGKVVEYLAGQHDKAKMDPAPVPVVNPAVAEFRKKMGGGK